MTSPVADTFTDLRRPPDLVRGFGLDGEIRLVESDDGVWAGAGVAVGLLVGRDRLSVRLRADVPVARLHLRWRADLATGTRFLGDHWERAYGDLEWRGEAPERVMPWYFLAHSRDGTHGYGVAVAPSALCFWTVDRAGISLWADVRSGGVPVELGQRVLDVCDVVSRRGEPAERAFVAHQRFCRLMCASPRLPDHPLYGTNDWYAAYGNNSRDLVCRMSDQVSSLVTDVSNRPYSVIDDGWSRGGLGMGPWVGNDRFGDMGSMARHLRDLGVRPGIWYRPLTPLPGVSDSWRMVRNGCLDPSVPEARELVAEQVRRMIEWGYQLIKHDFTSWDVFGRWGFAMGATITDDGWSFRDRSSTSAEVILALYQAIREAAGDAALIGCNTVGHLAAGLVEVQRIGDDVSSRSWSRTRRMGVNALAFRAAQHGTFFAVDADVAPVSGTLPWERAGQWLDLVAASGTALFVSIDPSVSDPGVLARVGSALALASSQRPTAEPIDWMDTVWPSRWLLNGHHHAFDWMDPAGGSPFGD